MCLEMSPWDLLAYQGLVPRALILSQQLLIASSSSSRIGSLLRHYYATHLFKKILQEYII